MKENYLHITSLMDGLDLYKALGSEVRIKIIDLLLENPNMKMNELASHLQLTPGALTTHIKKLEQSGIIQTISEPGCHGNPKNCSVFLDKVTIDFGTQAKYNNIYHGTIKIGHYSDYNVYPTCGLSTSTKLIGEVDDVRYFGHPDRFDASILWFAKGYIEYVVPSFIPPMQKIDQIALSFEICSEAPGVDDNWPSDIFFFINNICVGSYLSPGDFGDVKGLYTPDWWNSKWNQYGLLRLLVINHHGTFLNGNPISKITIDQFNLSSESIIKFKMAVPEDASHVGGLTIFGKSFGNYDQDIDVRINYSPIIQQ